MYMQPTTLKSRPSLSPSLIAALRRAASKMTGPKRRAFLAPFVDTLQGQAPRAHAQAISGKDLTMLEWACSDDPPSM